MSLKTQELLDSQSQEFENPLPIDALTALQLSVQEALANGIQPQELLSLDQIVIACGTGNTELSIKIAQAYENKYGVIELQKTMDPLNHHLFSDGERKPSYTVPLRKKTTVIVQSFTPERLLDNGQLDLETGINNQLVELQLMIVAARRANSKEIIVMMPYCAYLRQDRKRSGEPTSAADLLSVYHYLGAKSLVILDPHNLQVLSSFPGPIDEAPANYIFLPILREMIDPDKIIGLAPDAGGVTRMTELMQLLTSERSGLIANNVCVMPKMRDSVTGDTDSLVPEGIESGSTVIIADDILSTGGTIITAAEYAKKAGAKRVIVVVTHGLFLGDCLDRLRNCSIIECIITTNSIDHRQEVREEAAKPDGKIIIIDIAEYLADVIHCVLEGDPMKQFFEKENGIKK